MIVKVSVVLVAISCILFDRKSTRTRSTFPCRRDGSGDMGAFDKVMYKVDLCCTSTRHRLDIDIATAQATVSSFLFPQDVLC